MRVRHLQTVDGFVVLDLEDAECSAGLVRMAPKVLVDGATWMARSATYGFALFEQRRGGASAGICCRSGRHRASEIAAAELKSLLTSGSLVLDPGSGMPHDAIAPWLEYDLRPSGVASDRDLWTVRSMMVATETLAGGLDGRRVAIEGYDGAGVALAAALTDRGASVVAVGTRLGSVMQREGFRPDQLEVLSGVGDRPPAEVLGVEGDTAQAVLAADADVLFVGSKPGALDHRAAHEVTASWVVPWGPVPVTTKALAILARSGREVLPDFLTTAGPAVAAWAVGSSADPGSRPGAVEEAVGLVSEELRGSADSPYLAACRRAESFLASWRATMPFGRPLA